MAFIHIPKCAGTSVRQQLNQYAEKKDIFGGLARHDALGPVDMAHLPLRTLRDHFAGIFARLATLEAFAILRNPLDRFRSSLDEYAVMRTGYRLGNASKAEIASLVDEVTSAVGPETGLLPRRYIHFQPQESYVFLDGEQFVHRLYPLTRLDAFFADVSDRLGQPLNPEWRANQSLIVRSRSIEDTVLGANQLARRVLPRRSYHALKSLAVRVLTKSPDKRRSDVVAESREIRAFIEHYYAGDLDLYARTVDQWSDHAA